MSDIASRRFKCLENCGKCCTGEKGFVFLSESDMVRLERFLKRPRTEFVNWAFFTSTRHGDRKLFYLAKNEKHSCVFLNGTRCGVQDAKPTQCATFPFWPENLNPETWKKLKEEYCPGIDEGAPVPMAESLLTLQTMNDEEINGF